MRAVFLDRDGVLNECRVVDGKPYPPESIDSFRILPGAAEACAKLKQAGFALVVVTNQPDVGRGTQTMDAVEAMHDILRANLPLDAVYVCTHGSDSECDCRKPKPGMLIRAADDLGIDLASSFMVGDRWRDVDCGYAAGCQTVFIDYGYDERLRREPNAIVVDIAQAAEYVLGHSLSTVLDH